MGTPITVEAILLTELLKEIKKMNASLERLTREVAESRSVNESALALIAGLAEEIRDRIGDDAALEALADDLDAQQSEMSSAVAANTPAEASETSAPADETFPSDTGSDAGSTDIAPVESGGSDLGGDLGSGSDVGAADSGESEVEGTATSEEA